jgi:hypothetical protein
VFIHAFLADIRRARLVLLLALPFLLDSPLTLALRLLFGLAEKRVLALLSYDRLALLDNEGDALVETCRILLIPLTPGLPCVAIDPVVLWFIALGLDVGK